jgi:hypothetical protein
MNLVCGTASPVGRYQRFGELQTWCSDPRGLRSLSMDASGTHALTISPRRAPILRTGIRRSSATVRAISGWMPRFELQGGALLGYGSTRIRQELLSASQLQSGREWRATTMICCHCVRPRKRAACRHHGCAAWQPMGPCEPEKWALTGSYRSGHCRLSCPSSAREA